MKKLAFIFSVLPFISLAQDFTRQSGDALSTPADALLLVAPVHPFYLLSELDKKLSSASEVANVRERLRKSLNRRVTEAFSDSLKTFDLLMDDLEKVNRLEFLHKGLVLSYQEIIPEKGEKKGLQWPKKKEERTYQGAKVKVESGQLKREEILHKQYMGVSQVDPVMLEYMRGKQAFTHLLVITQVELRKNIYPGAATSEPYLIKVHYDLLDDRGRSLTGGFVERTLKEEEVQVGILCDEILVGMAKELTVKVYPAFELQVDDVKVIVKDKTAGEDNEDY